mmetsp:Transcript_34977/g.48868  ORF Transcript_34977/g.48868 Transcript_34977/m.48868 type:complete len:398 (-) Transcript_34977:67-1260(-)|eukprot:jgi/Bigna1/147203/aug1.132_g21911
MVKNTKCQDVERLFENFLSCSRPHESNCALVSPRAAQVQVKQEKQEAIPTASPPKSIVGKQREQKNRRQKLPNHRRTQQRRALVREVSPTGQSSRKVTLCDPKSKSKSRVYTTRTEVDSSSGDVPQIKDECVRKKCRDIVLKDGLLSGKKRPLDEKKLRRREQNRRAAVKSRKRKKVYLQELENKVKKLRETNDDLMAKMQALIAENEKLRKGVTVKASSPLPQSPAPSSLNCSPTPSSLSCDTFSKRSVSSTEENNLQDIIYSNVVKSESAELAIPQQMELTATNVFQHLSFLLLTILLAFGNQWKTFLAATTQHHQHPQRKEAGQRPSPSRLPISSLNKGDTDEVVHDNDRTSFLGSKKIVFQRNIQMVKFFQTIFLSSHHILNPLSIPKIGFVT